MEQKSFQTSEYGKLYLVPTPIGNLEDITLRALTVLKNVDLIAAEDTRHSGILLQHFQIKKPLISLHEHNYAQRVPELIEKLKDGHTIAQVSDAGMPSISDPGHEFVLAAIKAGIDVISLPGPTAGMTALIASGLPADRFAFIGFLPKKISDQKRLLDDWQDTKATLIFYESPYRVSKTLAVLGQQFGPSSQIVLARELTKKFESYFRGTLQEALAFVQEHQPRGEYVLLLQAHHETETFSEMDIRAAVQKRIDQGEKSIDAIKALAKLSGLHRAQVYEIFHTKGH